MAFLSQGETRLREIVQSVRELWQGRSFAVGEVTLRAGETTTVVPAPNCGAGARVFLSPRTASASGAVETTYVPVASVIAGQFTVMHANAVSVDRTFGYECRG